MSEQTGYDVFLSHRSEDKAVLRPLVERLRKDGLRAWFDEWEIKPGDIIPARIDEGLEHSRVMVLCMSANSFGSEWAQLEAGTFRLRDPLNEDRRFIPLRLDDVPIKGSLAQLLSINWRPADRESLIIEYEYRLYRGFFARPFFLNHAELELARKNEPLMTFAKFLENWDMTELELDIKFLKMKWVPQTADQNAAWELYVELLTRITTQALPAEYGDEKTALDSVYSLFPTTREIIKKHGKGCINFAKIAIPVLNQIVRPFTAKWHRASLAGALKTPDQCKTFRDDLANLQSKLTKYTRLLAGIARVEDITFLEAKSD